MLTEPNGLVHLFLIYARSQDPVVSGQGHAAKVVHKLVNDFKRSGHSIYTVSYTHLDVYKRQGIHNNSFTIEVINKNY